MRFSFISILTVAASIGMATASLNARDDVGTFDTFTDYECSEGSKSIDVTGAEKGYNKLPSDTKAFNSDLPDKCALLIWDGDTNGSPDVVIHPGRKNRCIPVGSETGNLLWQVVCVPS